MINKEQQDPKKEYTVEFKPVYSDKDLLSNLENARDTVIKDTFGYNTDTDDCMLEKCLSWYKQQAESKNAQVGEELLAFENAMEEWKTEKEDIQTRAREKQYFCETIERYAEKIHGEVLINRNYTCCQMTCTIDAVLITPNAVFLLNLRVPNRDSVVDANGNLCWFNTNSAQVVKENIRTELFKQELMVRMILSAASVKEFCIVPALVIGGDEYRFTNQDKGNVNSCRLASIEETLKTKHPECFPKKEERTYVLKRLWENTAITEDEKQLYQSKLLDAYMELRSKI